MKRTELREHIFKSIFSIEFNENTEMSEQLDLYLDDIEEAKERVVIQ